MKVLTVIYTFVLAGIIFLADTNGTNYFTFIKNVPFGDKIGHFLLMGGFSFLLNLALNVRTIRIFQLNFLMGSLIVFGLVTFEEISQVFIKGRTFDLSDLVFDYAGIFILGRTARFICEKQSAKGFFG